MKPKTEPFPEYLVMWVNDDEEKETARVDVMLIRGEFVSATEDTSVPVRFNTPLPLTVKRELEKLYEVFE